MKDIIAVIFLYAIFIVLVVTGIDEIDFRDLF